MRLHVADAVRGAALVALLLVPVVVAHAPMAQAAGETPSLPDSLRVGVIRWAPHKFVAGKDTVDTELGTLRVPERHAKPKGTTIELAFVRFRSTAAKPGAPIVYLAGGPGGSGIATARGRRFPLFMAMRAHGDVIALDQRGVGRSRPKLDCSQELSVPPDQPWTPEANARALAPLAGACAEQFRAAGVDLNAYNTNENADDLEALRVALGADRLRLWATSYGTHLALAAIRRHPSRIERAILIGTEGPDHTDKLPSNTQRLLTEISTLASRDSAIAAQLGGASLVTVLERALARLDRAPARVRLPKPGGAAADSVEVVLGREEVSATMAQILGSAEAQAYFPSFVLAADRGDYRLLALLELAVGVRRPGPIGSAMSFAMDCASGATAARSARIAREAKTTTLGNATNNVLVCDTWKVADLGDGFRAPVRAAMPVLFVSGTQDLNTPPSNAEEVRSGFPGAAHLVIEGVAHSDPLFLSSPRIAAVMLDFMAGKPVRDERVVVPFVFRHDLSELERFLR